MGRRRSTARRSPRRRFPAPRCSTRAKPNLRRQLTCSLRPVASRDARHVHPGSNNWAVSGKHTADGRALVANDMHLGIRVPHIWYRASFVWHERATDDKQEQRMTGVSLPGTPAMIVGSNGHVAWGFTNSEGDWVDVVIVDVDPHDKDSYLTPEGPRKFEHHEEIDQGQGRAG